MRLLSVVLFLWSFLLHSQYSITGKVVDAETGEALLGAHVYLLNNWKVGAITDLEGGFTLTLGTEDLSDSVVVSYVGFQERLVSLKETTIIEMEPLRVIGKTVVVTAKPLIAEEFKYEKINKIEIYTNPAAKADPLLAVASLPSSTTTDESANISLRGSSPVETGIFLNNVPIYDAVRFSQLNGIGTFSIFNTAIIENLTVFPGNPPLEFGNVTSGVVALRTDERILEVSKNAASLSLANVGFSREQKVNANQSLKLFSNWQPSGLIKDVNEEALEDILSFSSNDLGIYWYGANDRISWKTLSYSNLEGYKFNFQHPSFHGVFDQKKLRSFLISSVTRNFDFGEISLNTGASISKGEFAYSNVAFDVDKKDLFLGLNHLLTMERFSVKSGISYDHRFSSVDGNFHEYGYALGLNHPTIPFDQQLNLGTFETYAYLKYLTSEDLAVGLGVRKNLPTDSINYLSRQLNISYVAGDWSFTAGSGLYHKTGLFENSGTPFFAESTQHSLDVKYETSLFSWTASIFDKVSKVNGQDTEVFGVEVFGDYRFSRKIRASASYTWINVGGARQENLQYDINYFIRGNVSYRTRSFWTVESNFLIREGSRYSPVTSAILDTDLSVFEPRFSGQRQRLSPYSNIGLAVSKIVGISENTEIIAFVSVNNVLDSENVRSFMYNFDYTDRAPNLYSLRTIYFGAVVNF